MFLTQDAYRTKLCFVKTGNVKSMVSIRYVRLLQQKIICDQFYKNEPGSDYIRSDSRLGTLYESYNGNKSEANAESGFGIQIPLKYHDKF